MAKQQNKIRQNVRKLFKDRRDHHYSIFVGIAPNQQKDQLPGECDTDKTVVKLGVVDRRWTPLADKPGKEIKWQCNQDAPDSGHGEDDLGEFQFVLLY